MDNLVLERNMQLYDVISNHHNLKRDYKINEIGTIGDNNKNNEIVKVCDNKMSIGKINQNSTNNIYDNKILIKKQNDNNYLFGVINSKNKVLSKRFFNFDKLKDILYHIRNKNENIIIECTNFDINNLSCIKNKDENNCYI